MSNYHNGIQIFKALADNNRLTILEYLKNGETCACVLIEELGIAQSALSYHMKILCQSGLVRSRQKGKWKHYSLSAAAGQEAVDLLNDILSLHDPSSNNCECRQKSS
ncbi:ArsR/SmtB family transcription factor [Streptococcus dysgalactiae]|uniref:ArsR/SmtB family transcription factor n=1 Tax=Streptococcus dysgalactiae TaxID=1334 RepID=UPI0001F866D3|nr:metalloregulator ArsR/SmtB family transcription factor [Streptococcus dysgalactiae]EFY02856.1 transcriptional regulator, ArsR family protein [Streptococcus dysgalactiae subsp. dysgalactiae ATCC 27957]MCB2829356.1 metalloregulator ArsR/SmtB family transcription factor [Streptococcus dysgalactiae subsp. dysgalactiae]MCB2831671.1 metalloregulator ArsR/SmtB family transcription factor [Streptococcus dysgalactiae subsp. dysgalactiae]MCB2835378.1 metalloregulator ArsR/SmtB family transcription fac